MRISKPPQERKAELVAAARCLFDERGVQKTRVSDIVHAVGVAQGVFYYYFTSKKEIITEVITQVDAETEARAKAILNDETSPFYQKLAQFIELYLSLTDQFLADGDTDLSALHPKNGAENPTARGNIIITQNLLRLVRQGVASGQVPAAYPEQSTLALLYGLYALAARQMPPRQMIYTLAEQALCLPGGGLVQYYGKAYTQDTVKNNKTIQGEEAKP